MTYILRTTRGVVFTLDEQGYVQARTNGPEGFAYGKGWQILGAATRHHAHSFRTLEQITHEGIPGQGWVHDVDHGTHRVWMGHPGRMESLVRAD